jgi:hypothetical protein
MSPKLYKNVDILIHYMDTTPNFKSFGKKDIEILLLLIPKFQKFLKINQFKVTDKDINEFALQWIIENTNYIGNRTETRSYTEISKDKKRK